MSTDVTKGRSGQQRQQGTEQQQQRQQQTGQEAGSPGTQRFTGKTRDQESAREFLWSEQGSRTGRERQQTSQVARNESEQQRRQRERNQPRS